MAIDPRHMQLQHHKLVRFMRRNQLAAQDLADYLGISVRTVFAWRYDPTSPHHRHIPAWHWDRLRDMHTYYDLPYDIEHH